MSEPDWARPVVHWELRATDPAKQKAFYAAMFNWNIGDGPIMNIPLGIGAPEPGISGHIAQGRPGFSLSIQVRDLNASLLKAVELGGQVKAQPRDLPAGPTVAGILDPEGNWVTLVQQ
jgi:predicted enzyme related to lactoylglutathione lyase